MRAAARECPEGSFRCDNGQCLDRVVFCSQEASGTYGCADGSVHASEVCGEHSVLPDGFKVKDVVMPWFHVKIKLF